jgi:hypothetical protein
MISGSDIFLISRISSDSRIIQKSASYFKFFHHLKYSIRYNFGH